MPQPSHAHYVAMSLQRSPLTNVRSARSASISVLRACAAARVASSLPQSVPHRFPSDELCAHVRDKVAMAARVRVHRLHRTHRPEERQPRRTLNRRQRARRLLRKRRLNVDTQDALVVVHERVLFVPRQLLLVRGRDGQVGDFIGDERTQLRPVRDLDPVLPVGHVHRDLRHRRAVAQHRVDQVDCDARALRLFQPVLREGRVRAIERPLGRCAHITQVVVAVERDRVQRAALERVLPVHRAPQRRRATSTLGS
mmetsp:Transcript_1038/g.2707  ORF Transcript_1038/g.2707 Transcript_1038/m.2707 type:complete len:254 (-) Transcript_1038:5-766(-)